jgi:hypothetical protein
MRNSTPLDGSSRLPGGVLQPEATAFCSGVPVPGGVREEVVSES